MQERNDTYEAVIGLEIHARLATASKLFCADSNAYGAEPNTLVSPISLAHPGTLPMVNKNAIVLATKMGLACNCTITPYNYFARKNYFYPDLPKGYQVSQHTTPICTGGYLTIDVASGTRDIQLNRIHLEEDAGKSLHEMDQETTMLDFNRAGTPLIEIVTEPVIHSSEEAHTFLAEIRRLVKWLDVCDGNMEEGSLRCDANISIRRKGTKKLGVKVEVKNLNSLRFLKKAIETEIQRQISLLHNEQPVIQETRSYDAVKNSTFSMREKEDADDYRYFPEPDLPPIHLTPVFIQAIKETMPALPREKEKIFVETYNLPPSDAARLCADKAIADYFEEVAGISMHYKAIANWLLGPVSKYLNENKLDFSGNPCSATNLASVISMVAENKISFSVAASRLLPALMENPLAVALDIATAQNLLLKKDDESLEKWVHEVIEKMPDKVKLYQQGKKGLIGLMMGEVKKISKGKADPAQAIKLLEKKLSEPIT